MPEKSGRSSVAPPSLVARRSPWTVSRRFWSLPDVDPTNPRGPGLDRAVAIDGIDHVSVRPAVSTRAFGCGSGPFSMSSSISSCALPSTPRPPRPGLGRRFHRLRPSPARSWCPAGRNCSRRPRSARPGSSVGGSPVPPLVPGLPDNLLEEGRPPPASTCAPSSVVPPPRP